MFRIELTKPSTFTKVAVMTADTVMPERRQ